jgi:spermidine/putrescine-binding protein
MKTFLKKIFSIASLLCFAAALVTPAHAARTGGSTIIIITTPKPVVSAF